ncbi:multicopper oxidase [Karstenula rhodostoma CBS 690.94]|uniref:Multicopper oxidase n=1 Tax=Karstenula rhodostoma CBS 690.94 TaxID=1392251 RepID=A0A9P4PVN2_9PLEO|nr:multicopper oxidase [Karstenula rhodostoma CBS 690.94]
MAKATDADTKTEPIRVGQRSEPRVGCRATNAPSSVDILFDATVPGIAKTHVSIRNRAPRHLKPEDLGTKEVPIPDPNSVPTTGVIRPYYFTISRSDVAPDGVHRAAILVNDRFPGPTIEADWGDIFEITIQNNITGPNEGTAIHWHGFLHKGAPNALGRHSHYSSQLIDGLWGPMVVRGYTTSYHASYEDNIRDQFSVPSNLVIAGINLINGKCLSSNLCDSRLTMFRSYNHTKVPEGTACQADAPIATFNFQPNKTHLLHLINTSGEGTQVCSIDYHVITIISNNFVPTEPYEADHVILGPGKRLDVVVTGTGGTNTYYYAHASVGPHDPVFHPNAVAVVYYPVADQTKPLFSDSAFSMNTSYCQNAGSKYTHSRRSYPPTCQQGALSKAVPAFAQNHPSQPEVTQEIRKGVKTNEPGHTILYMNNIPFRANYNYPILPLANARTTSYPDDPQWNVDHLRSNSSIRIILYNTASLFHPIHMQGHNIWVPAAGSGEEMS